jgi:carbamoyl-phosphate synthase small subunit
MAGYQEVLTDPSYLGQIVTFTAPHIGNYGVNPSDAESGAVRVAGLAVREASRRASSWRSTGGLSDHLSEAGVVGIDGLDTRRLTLRVRDAGAMRSAISTVDLDPVSLVERVRAQRGMEGADLAAAASCAEAYEAADVVGPAARTSGSRPLRVAAFDFGLKRNILRLLHAHGCETVVFPATTPAAEVLSGGFDGAFLSNGPGDPAATTYGIETAAALLDARIPTLGICLGHQLLALALGGATYKMKFGHRGVNQPVKDLDSGRIEISSHNHGFAVDPGAWPGGEDGARRVGSTHGELRLNRWNLNDGTLEGFRCVEAPAFGVQYHPEAAPGPHDAGHLFGAFRDLMEPSG